jgi:hypothetical protein
MPCKHRRPGSIPGVSTCAIGIEEDGNLPDSDSGETRFDSGGPDVTGCGAAGSAPALKLGMRVRFRRGAPSAASSMVRAADS